MEEYFRFNDPSCPEPLPPAENGELDFEEFLYCFRSTFGSILPFYVLYVKSNEGVVLPQECHEQIDGWWVNKEDCIQFTKPKGYIDVECIEGLVNGELHFETTTGLYHYKLTGVYDECPNPYILHEAWDAVTRMSYIVSVAWSYMIYYIKNNYKGITIKNLKVDNRTGTRAHIIIKTDWYGEKIIFYMPYITAHKRKKHGGYHLRVDVTSKIFEERLD